MSSTLLVVVDDDDDDDDDEPSDEANGAVVVVVLFGKYVHDECIAVFRRRCNADAAAAAVAEDEANALPRY